jgi:O-acetyl-ADP-ribose deacetylase (regulator of RNase III)
MKTINGNILDAKEQFIGHQCNCVSRGALGLAKSLFDRFPQSNIYSHRPYPYVAKGDDLPGHIVIRGNVIGLLAQYYPGRSNEKSLIDSSIVREGYFWQCLRQIAKIENLESIAFPFRIGCGLSAGNWGKYYKMLEWFDQIVYDKQKTNVVIYKL